MNSLRVAAVLTAIAIAPLLAAGTPESSYITPPKEFFDSTLVARPGVLDFGNLSVKDFASAISKSVLADGSHPKVHGWTKAGLEYVLHVTGGGRYQLHFLYDKPGRFSVLQPIKMNKQEFPAALYVMSVLDAVPSQ